MHVQPLGTCRSNRRRNDGLLLAAKQAAFTGMRIQPGHGDARRPAQAGAHGSVRNTQRLQHIVKSHSLDGVTQRHMDADQHGFQFVIGQHHAHRHVAHGPAQKGRCLGLQHFGVTGELRRPAARCRQRFLVNRRGDQRLRLARQHGTGRPDNAIRCCFSSQITHEPIRDGHNQLTFL